MKLYTADGQYAATIKIAGEIALIEGPFKSEIKAIIGKERELFVRPIKTKEGIGDEVKILPANSIENVKEFLAYPRRWGFTRENL